MKRTDVVVIGGGHAGCEAAAAAARMGAKTVLVTMRRETIGEMSCNPAIGGIGKGHLVREIDALDGLMARAIDRAGIHFKILNRSKGPAVRGPRAQADRALYRQAIQSMLAEQSGLSIIEGEVVDIGRDVAGAVVAVFLADGTVLSCGAVVLTAGTFLRGALHVGSQVRSGGRCDDRSSDRLADRLINAGLPVGRLKTGTPPRLARASIDWNGLARDDGDTPPEPFSTLTRSIETPQIACRVTATNERTHAVVRSNLAQSALHGGRITGRGPRYCPSIEDKIEKFASRDQHQIFLEPEGLDSPVVYPNGISTSLPAAVQDTMVRTIRGLERAEIVRYGYAVEYDFIDPRALDQRLEVKAWPGLFLAGQINGTTGYEEAAAQGIMAGINAASRCAGASSFTLSRADAYIGVLIDDLVTQGVSEPYRMLTSRAEFRLSLRADNADHRLTERGLQIGVVGAERGLLFDSYAALCAAALLRAKSERTARTARDGRQKTVFEGLAAAEPTDVPQWFACLPDRVQAHLRNEAAYDGYLDRQSRDIRALRAQETHLLDTRLDYETVRGLSREARERLASARPRSLGDAARVQGVTPAAVVALMAHLQRAAEIA